MTGAVGRVSRLTRAEGPNSSVTWRTVTRRRTCPCRGGALAVGSSATATRGAGGERSRRWLTVTRPAAARPVEAGSDQSRLLAKQDSSETGPNVDGSDGDLERP